jgi:hypothetical protein
MAMEWANGQARSGDRGMSVLRGMVFSGCGDYAQWIAKYQEYYRAKTGLTLFPGTLNLRLPGPYELPPRQGTSVGGTRVWLSRLSEYPPSANLRPASGHLAA